MWAEKPIYKLQKNDYYTLKKTIKTNDFSYTTNSGELWLENVEDFN